MHTKMNPNLNFHKDSCRPYVPSLVISVLLAGMIIFLSACIPQVVEDDGRIIAHYEDAWGFFPSFTEQIHGVGDVFYNGNATLPPIVIELGALTAARYWTSEIDWIEHQGPAAEAGLSSAVIESIQTWQAPDFQGDSALATAYQYCIEMLTYKQVTEVTHLETAEQFGLQGTVELAGVLGHHTMIALTTRAFRLNAATLPDLPPGAWDIELDESEVEAPRMETFGLPFSPLGWPMNTDLNAAESVLGLAFPFSSEEFHELGIILAARSWNSPVPWGAHVLSAVGSGIDPQAARAIGLWEDASSFLTEEQLALYRMGLELFDASAEVDVTTYDNAVAVFGRPHLTKLVTGMGYYSQVSLAVNNAKYVFIDWPDYPFPME